MQFNEILDKEGIDQVALKTNISLDNLIYLSEENFEGLNRVKALGFLLILEREYPNVDVSSLRENIKLYFDEHKPADENVVMISKDRMEEGGFSFFKWFIILALLGGGYYFYSQGQLNGLIETIEEKKDFFDNDKALESNVTEEEAGHVRIQESKNEQVAIATPIEPTEKKISLIGEESKKDLNITKNVINENNNSINVQKETTTELEQSAESVVQEVVASAEDAVAKTVEEVVSAETNNTLNSTVVSLIKTITINPTRGMLWYGFINLDTKKKREFMKKVSTPFDIKDGRWLLVTGHGYVDIVSDIETLELADRNKHYFYIDSHELRVLSKQEFRAMNGRRGW